MPEQTTQQHGSNNSKILGVHRLSTTVNWIQYPKWQAYIGRSVPLVSAADWLNSQSADRLNIRSADWPAARSSGDITQADQPTLQKPSAPSPLIRDTTHTTYSHTNNHIIQHTRTINNEVASNTLGTWNVKKPSRTWQINNIYKIIKNLIALIEMFANDKTFDETPIHWAL